MNWIQGDSYVSHLVLAALEDVLVQEISSNSLHHKLSIHVLSQEYSIRRNFLSRFLWSKKEG